MAYLTGSDGKDILTGTDVDDIIDGFEGADTMKGGRGNDTYYVDDRSDSVQESDGEGIDTIISSVDIDLARETTHSGEIENITLSDDVPGDGDFWGGMVYANDLDNEITGNRGMNTFYGRGGKDRIYGGKGIDTLYGGDDDDILDGGEGADNMFGNEGNDTYIVDNASDFVSDWADEDGADGGIDTVLTSVDFGIDSRYNNASGEIENITAVGEKAISIGGNALNNVLTGNKAANTLYAGEGNDVLDGGLGADTMYGLTGNDIYIVDDAGDVVHDGDYGFGAGDGIDTVKSSISFSLVENGKTVFGLLENLTLTGSDNINGTGNDLNNVIIGNDGNNIIDGGRGADTMKGGKGDDTYVVDDAGDKVIEKANEGTDTVKSSVSYTLGDNLENLTLLGSGLINGKGTGNDLDNIIIGNDGKNFIDGGKGADTMRGGLGADIYYVDNVGDVVEETGGDDPDQVDAVVSFTLGANVEGLSLSGHDDINGTGNELTNFFYDNDGTNTLKGLAGNDSFWAFRDGKQDTLIGGTGNDTYVIYDEAVDTIIEAENEGTDTVYAYHSHRLEANIENLKLIGDGDDTATGNDLGNSITGNNSSNVIDGGKGADSMQGADGDDTYIVDNLGDVVEEEEEAGTDTVKSSVSYTLGDNLENLTLTGSNNINGTGNALNNTITGNGGNNVLDGGKGADTMKGGKGDDTYYMDNDYDSVQESEGEGIDTIISSVSIDLIDNKLLSGEIENITLSDNFRGDWRSASGFVVGNDLNNVIIGNSGANGLSGYGGNDTIYGGGGRDSLYGNDGDDYLDGGEGDDQMFGHAGNDTYVVDNIADRVTDNGKDGATDTVLTSVDFTLSSGVENLELMQVSAEDILAGHFATKGTGNDLGNVIIGNDFNNIIDGGKGADTMKGGKGDDTYVVDDAGDKVIEKANEGTDTVKSSVSYTLGDNLENLTLLGSDNINGTGNALNNTITGNGGNNVLDGGGRDFRVDTLIGGKGDDTYIIDDMFDRVVEEKDGGIDTVQSSAAVTRLADNVENLIITGNQRAFGLGNDIDNTITGNNAGGALYGFGGDDRLIGGTGDDNIIGDDGNDTIIGNGGRDVLMGGEGKDSFIFNSAISTLNMGAIFDFVSGQDRLVLDRSVFGALNKGDSLKASEFLTYTKGGATTADQRILHNKATGEVFYDADGSGKGAAILFAHVGAGHTLSATDFAFL